MIQITNNNRVMICGTTGSGKTVLAKYLLQMCNRVVVIDPKHEFNLEGFKVNKNLSVPSVWQKDFRMIIRPRPGKNSNDEEIAEFLHAIYKRKNVTIYCDELAVMEEEYPESISQLRVIALTGRSRHVSLWNATQRPRGIPKIFFTESEVFFIFRLQDEDDRDHVAGYIGEEVKDKIPHRMFWYYRGEEENPRLLTLDLKKEKIFQVEVTYQEEREV